MHTLDLNCTISLILTNISLGIVLKDLKSIKYNKMALLHGLKQGSPS